MLELVFVGEDGQAVFVDLDYEGNVLDVYGYVDSVPEIPGVSWAVGPHTPYPHASDLKRAFAWLLTNWQISLPGPD